MEVSKVIIENWPKTPWYKNWPLIIAIIALLCWTRNEFIRSVRPFVWASNYRVIDSNNFEIPIPYKVAFRVKNSPARISRMDVKIILNKNVLLSYTEKDIVRYPDESTEWYFIIGGEQYNKIMEQFDIEKSKLIRDISIEYSSLDNCKIYHFELEQLFVPNDNQWKTTFEKAD
ncbi:MAG: hypothetical protein JEY97_07635 [Bacteroidales bacterium]|nr:hypothetical protein [Bacteroidales bacterium]